MVRWDGMAFISLPFVLFFAVFFLVYWLIFRKGNKGQNLLLLAGSYLFYAWGDWHFLPLLAGISLLNYWLGIGISRRTSEAYKTMLLWVGLIAGIGSLLYFKYFHSFLPLGLSYFTFKTMAYLLDIKKGKIGPTVDWIVFFGYVSFFPCMVAGPIDRPGTLIPQLEKKREFRYDQAADGMRQLLWGLFKKVVIADNAAGTSADIFLNYATLPASALLYGALLTTIWIYADFSGYSDMALGLARLLGLEVTRNFQYPFFAHNIAEYWRRWHISLTDWMREYVFTPLSIYFRHLGKAGLILAILINFIAIGLWHGPNLTFVLFGLLHGCYFIPLVLWGTTGKRGSVLNMAGVFILVTFANILFRAASLEQALGFYRRLFSPSIVSPFFIFEKVNTMAMWGCIVVMFAAEWLQRDRPHPLQIDFIRQPSVRALIYFTLIFLILTFAPTRNADFIYLRF